MPDATFVAETKWKTAYFNLQPADALQIERKSAMGRPQKALIVTRGAAQVQGLAELNEALQQGWRVVHLSPMGGGAPDGLLAALVVIEQDTHSAAKPMEEAEEEVEEVVEEIVEGNGSEAGLAGELKEERNGGASPS